MEKINGPKPVKLETGDKDLKKVKEKLSKIKIDENFISERINQLITEGYTEEEAKKIAGIEAMIKTDNDRITLYKENPELKDASEIIQKILIKRDANQKEVNELLSRGVENKNIKSNRQLLREAEDRLRNMSVDMNIVKKEKSDLLGEGYPFDFSEKLSNLNGEIRLLQNKIQILIENPKIENGMKFKKNLEEKLIKLEKERNTLLTSKPEPTKNEITNNEITRSNEEPVIDEYDEAGIEGELKNSIPNEKIKTEKTSKKMNWGKLNPFSWFKKNKEENKVLEKTEEVISDEDFNSFVNNNTVNEQIINNIANKYKTGGKLTEREKAIAYSNMPKIEEILKNSNPDDIGKVLDQKIAEVKNEKKKTLYTKEQQKEFFDGLKEKLKNGEIGEADFRDAVLKRTVEIHNFEKSSVYKAMDKWDNWGKDGGVGKYAKMAINIAMIAGVSTFAVDKAAEMGIGTASALTNGTTTAIGKRILFGLAGTTVLGGMFSAFDKYPPEKKKKIGTVIKNITLALSAGLAFSTGGILPAVAILGSAGFGMIVSKKIQQSEGRSKSNIEKLKKIPIDLKNIDNKTALIEYEIREALKQADKSKMWRKAGGTAAAILSSMLILETSGYINDHLNDTSSTETADDNINEGKPADGGTTEEGKATPDIKDDDVKEGASGSEKNEDSNKNNQATEKENDNAQKENDEKIEDAKKSYVGEKEIGAIADKGQGAISTIKELKDNLEKTYENVPEKDIPENVKHIIDTDEHDLAKEYGMYRPGEESESAKVFSGDKIIFDQETGEVKFHQEKTGEDIVLEKGKEFGGDMFDSGKFKTPVENVGTETTGGETSQFEKEYPQTSPEKEIDNYYVNKTENENSNIIIDGEEVKAPEISEKELIETKKLAESYGIDSERYRGETESEYLNRMKEEIAEEKEALKQELASGEKMSLDKTLKAVHGEKVEIEKLKELKQITKGYEGAIGQPSLRDIMEKIKEQGLKAIITKDVGETPIDAQTSVNEKMHLIEKSLGGQKGYNYEFAQKLPDGNVKILHIKLFRE